MPKKHLILIHGRSAKPRKAEKERLAREALTSGLMRISETAAERIGEEVAFTFVYYGDLINKVLVEAQPDAPGDLVETEDGAWYKPEGHSDEAIKRLIGRPSGAHTKSEYRELVRKHGDLRFVDDVARIVSPLLANGLSRSLIASYMPDLAAYFTDPAMGAEVRRRLLEPLAAAVRAGEDVALISHGSGCMAAYDALWMLSHDEAYADLRDRRVHLWATLGSPLGEPSIRQALLDAKEPADRQFPRNVDVWLNISAADDYIAHDASVEDDFRQMKANGIHIIDLPRIYNFYIGSEGSNPHNLYGYLNHPVVAQHLAGWILDDRAAG